MDYSGMDELLTLEEGAPKYNDFLVKEFKRTFEANGVHNRDTLLDYGAGIGTLSQIFSEAYGYHVQCLEIDRKQREVLSTRGFKVISGLDEIESNYSGVYLSNVLEHIENDAEVINEIAKKALKREGVLIIYVPALPWLFSPLDRKLGHYRRYTKKNLEYLVKLQGLKIIRSEYVDSIGIVGWIIQKFISSVTKKVTPNHKLVSIYDTFLFPISRIFDSIGFKWIAGKNVLVVAIK